MAPRFAQVNDLPPTRGCLRAAGAVLGVPGLVGGTIAATVTATVRGR